MLSDTAGNEEGRRALTDPSCFVSAVVCAGDWRVSLASDDMALGAEHVRSGPLYKGGSNVLVNDVENRDHYV